MKKITVAVLASIFLTACFPKPQYATSVGKKKQKYYNAIQYGTDAHPKKNF
jgi:hypothetical protein